MLRDFTWTEKYEEAMPDEHPPILCGSLLEVFSKGTAYESRRIPVSNLKTLRG